MRSVSRAALWSVSLLCLGIGSASAEQQAAK